MKRSELKSLIKEVIEESKLSVIEETINNSETMYMNRYQFSEFEDTLDNIEQHKLNNGKIVLYNADEVHIGTFDPNTNTFIFDNTMLNMDMNDIDFLQPSYHLNMYLDELNGYLKGDTFKKIENYVDKNPRELDKIVDLISQLVNKLDSI